MNINKALRRDIKRKPKSKKMYDDSEREVIKKKDKVKRPTKYEWRDTSSAY